jgi:hypothetical protein
MEPDKTILVLMTIAFIVGAMGIGLAWMFYGRGPSPSLAKVVEGPLAGAYEASKNKLWFDEIYDRVFVRPFKAVARGLFEVVDRFIIDTVAVNGAAFAVGLFGRLSRWIQNGQVQRYLAGVVVGAAAVFLVTDCHSHPTFQITRAHDQLKLHAEPGSGVVGANARLHWHLDGSTNCAADRDKPSQPADLTVHAGDAAAEVTLCIDDAIARKTVAVTRPVPVEETTP